MGFNQYLIPNLQQNFKDSTTNDASLMQTEAVVLLIEAFLHDGSRVPLYCNEARNSEQSTRPLQMVFEKETTATNEAEGERLMKEMNDLQASPYIPKSFPNLSVKFKGFMTMVDGKVVNIMTKNPSTQRCPFCHVLQSQFNDPTADFSTVEGALDFGLSVLHFGLRSMEFFLHAAYNMDFKRHRCEGKQNKKLKKARKKNIQAKFWQRLRLHIDVPRDSGQGTSNTGFIDISQIKNLGKKEIM